MSKKLGPIGAVFLHVVIRKYPNYVDSGIFSIVNGEGKGSKPTPDDRSAVTAAVVATVYSVGVLAARIAAGMACPLLVGLLH